MSIILLRLSLDVLTGICLYEIEGLFSVDALENVYVILLYYYKMCASHLDIRPKKACKDIKCNVK